MAVAGLLVLAGVVGVPYWVARVLWRVRMPLPVRVPVVVAIPAVLVWWTATSPDFADITSPGAALFPLAMILGWSLGASWPLRRKLGAVAGGDSLR